MTFTENWFCTQSCVALQALAIETRDVPGAVIEVGAWEGKSTIALAQACDHLHTVDTWEGSPGEPSEVLASERDVFARFLQNIAPYPNVTWHRTNWRDFFAVWDQPIRLVFIDAEHTYHEVRDNIAAALPYLSPGGIVCGDDMHHQPIRDAVRDTLGEFTVESSLWIWRNHV